MISVIIPVYNVKPYLEEAIDSVIHQTYQDFEIILVDDGSTDGSGELCDEYLKKDTRIKVIHQENKGLSAARNAGLDICQGEVISFLDSDDAYCHDMLRRMLEVMNETNADIVECDILEHESKRPLKPDRIRNANNCLADGWRGLMIYDTRGALHHQLTGEIFNSVWNKIYRRKIWEQLRFREGQNYEDFDIILPLLSQITKMCLINEGLVLYRKRPESITCTNTESNIRSWLQAYKHYLNYIETNIPTLFDTQEYEIALRKRFPYLLNKYFLSVALGDSDRNELAREIKDEIIRIKGRIDHRKLSVKVKAALFMASFLSPSIAGWLFRIYCKLR